MLRRFALVLQHKFNVHREDALLVQIPVYVSFFDCRILGHVSLEYVVMVGLLGHRITVVGTTDMRVVIPWEQGGMRQLINCGQVGRLIGIV